MCRTRQWLLMVLAMLLLTEKLRVADKLPHGSGPQNVAQVLRDEPCRNHWPCAAQDLLIL